MEASKPKRDYRAVPFRRYKVLRGMNGKSAILDDVTGKLVVVYFSAREAEERCGVLNGVRRQKLRST